MAAQRRPFEHFGPTRLYIGVASGNRSSEGCNSITHLSFPLLDQSNALAQNLAGILIPP